ncbi:abortive infection system toxin AbiGii family protein, partial [Ruminococcus bicirculans (ex Wegman et al. 2014)]|uniref:abortive infection system toxin AbiGii family protein n=1 Tax=Ruminococcus bicirculans (ex Wegman et al. 2014) TaxID=1160721 RepID=UPI003A8D1813
NICNDNIVKPIGVLEPKSLPEICLKLSDSQDESISADVHLQMQRCDNVERCTYSNSNQNEVMCVNMEIDTEYANVELYNISLHIYIGIKKAKSVKEVVNAYKLYEALINNRLLINGKPFIYTNGVDEDKFKGVQLGLDLYKKLEILEEALSVQFIPSIETEVEELYYVNWLYSSLVEKKPFIEKATINNIVATKSKNRDLIKEESKGQLFAFCLNGKLELTIFGQDITVYYIRIHDKLKIKGFEPMDNEEVKILFDDDENKNQAVYMLYRTEQELDDVVSDDNFIGEIMSLDKNDYTTF